MAAPRVCPDGGYYVRKSDDSSQPMLIQPEPDLRPLRHWVLERLRARPHRWNEFEEAIRAELWRATHLNQMIRELRREKAIVAESSSGMFSAKANPLLRLRRADE